MFHHGVFYTDSFFDLSFDFDCTLTGQMGFWRILQVAALAFLRAIYVCKIIAYHTTIWITAAASGHACKSVLNPYVNQRTKVKKNPCQSLRVHRWNPWVFFDLRSVAEAHRTNYDKAYLYSYSNNIYNPNTAPKEPAFNLFVRSLR